MKKKIVFIIFLLNFQVVFASGKTVLPNLWIYDAIEYINARGYLLSLKNLPKPYYREDIAEALFYFDKSNVENNTILEKVHELEKMVKPELDELQSGFHPISKLYTGIEVHGILERRRFLPEQYKIHFQDEVPIGFRFRGRPSIGFYFLNSFSLQLSSIVQQSDIVDIISPYYAPIGFLETAYISYRSSLIRIKIGKDYVAWGYAKNNFAITFHANPLNHLLFNVHTKPITFTYILSEIKSPSDPIYKHNYLSASRLGLAFNLFAVDVRFSVWQMAMQSISRKNSIEWSFINPITVYDLQDPLSHNINTIAGFDFFISKQGVSIYGSVILHHLGFSDQKTPNSWAIMGGIKIADILYPISISGTDILLEGGYAEQGTFTSRLTGSPSFKSESFALGHPLSNPAPLFPTTPFSSLDQTGFYFVELEAIHSFSSLLNLRLGGKLYTTSLQKLLIPENFHLSSTASIPNHMQSFIFHVGSTFRYWGFLQADFIFNYISRSFKTYSKTTNIKNTTISWENDVQVKLAISLSIEKIFTLLEE